MPLSVTGDFLRITSSPGRPLRHEGPGPPFRHRLFFYAIAATATFHIALGKYMKIGTSS